MKSTEFKPLRDYMLVKPLEHSSLTPGGILLPDKRKQEATTIGQVLRVGPGLIDGVGQTQRAGVKAGDLVCYPTFVGFEVKLEDGVFRAVYERDAIATDGADPVASLAPQPIKRIVVAIDEETPAFPVDASN